MSLQVLESSLDASVNFVTPSDDGGAFEARFVQREPRYFICYLSSHSGCRQGCRFCHLTATRQAMMTPVDLPGFVRQADQVLAHYDGLSRDERVADRVNFNWMSRGEALANPCVLNDFDALSARLAQRARDRSLTPKHNVSTILPRSFEGRSLVDTFKGADGKIVIYYSLYSMRREFRRRWLPTALDGRRGLDLLADYQTRTGNDLVLHWAFIAGENDDEETVGEIIEEVTARGIRAKFNLVAYNPYSELEGVEPEPHILERNFRLIADALGNPNSRMVPRVGFDVKASCGMFVETGAGLGASDRRARAQRSKRKQERVMVDDQSNT